MAEVTVSCACSALSMPYLFIGCVIADDPMLLGREEHVCRLEALWRQRRSLVLDLFVLLCHSV